MRVGAEVVLFFKAGATRLALAPGANVCALVRAPGVILGAGA
ncbi:MAG: hypothetical protein ACM3NF_11185 [Gemmatimonadota bacterium]